MIEEGGAGNWTFGGNDLSGIVALVIATVTVAKGVLDEQSRARFAELGHKAVAEALPGETRRISSSFLFNEIEDGMWVLTDVSGACESTQRRPATGICNILSSPAETGDVLALRRTGSHAGNHIACERSI